MFLWDLRKLHETPFSFPKLHSVNSFSILSSDPLNIFVCKLTQQPAKLGNSWTTTRSLVHAICRRFSELQVLLLPSLTLSSYLPIKTCISYQLYQLSTLRPPKWRRLQWQSQDHRDPQGVETGAADPIQSTLVHSEDLISKEGDHWGSYSYTVLQNVLQNVLQCLKAFSKNLSETHFQPKRKCKAGRSEETFFSRAEKVWMKSICGTCAEIGQQSIRGTNTVSLYKYKETGKSCIHSTASSCIFAKSM